MSIALGGGQQPGESKVNISYWSLAKSLSFKCPKQLCTQYITVFSQSETGSSVIQSERMLVRAGAKIRRTKIQEIESQLKDERQRERTKEWRKDGKKDRKKEIKEERERDGQEEKLYGGVGAGPTWNAWRGFQVLSIEMLDNDFTLLCRLHPVGRNRMGFKRDSSVHCFFLDFLVPFNFSVPVHFVFFLIFFFLLFCNSGSFHRVSNIFFFCSYHHKKKKLLFLLHF